ncbi:hypothetical protein Tco_0510202, partial [Tanacetum coccineum]
KEKYKSLALKAKQVLSDDDTSSSDSNDKVIALKTLLVIKRHSLLEVGAIVEMPQRKKRFVSWLTQTRYYPIIFTIVVHL